MTNNFHIPIFLLTYLLTFWAAAIQSGCNTRSEGETSNQSNNRQQDPRPNIIVIFTDDQGYGDLGANNATPDIRTPQIDSLAQNGVRMTNGYVTAPQCAPSRAALMTGVYQQRFGLDDNSLTPLPLEVPTAAQHLKNVGYRTGMVGKWHLDVLPASATWIDSHRDETQDTDPLNDMTLTEPYQPWKRGFDECFSGHIHKFWATFDPDNDDIFPARQIVNKDDRIDLIHRAAESFIRRNSNNPFFLYVAPFAPHVPLSATDDYLAQLPDDMPVRRRYALAMLAAVDDGVGRIVSMLKTQGIYENTLIFFISDNGAPLGIEMADAPINDNTAVWNGSMNTPMTGEKGMLTDGGIRIPYVLHWPAMISGNHIISQPVSSLDAVYTMLNVAGISADILSKLDGTNLLPAVFQNSDYLRDRPLFWRFWDEAAVRLGNWKFLRTSKTDMYLFNMSQPEHATRNVIDQHPDVAAELRQLLEAWEASLANGYSFQAKETRYYQHYLHADSEN